MLCRFKSGLKEILYSLLKKRFERGRACPADHGWDVVADDLDWPPAKSHGPQELPDQLRPLQVRRHPVHLVPRRLHRRHSKPPTAGVQGTTYISVHCRFSQHPYPLQPIRGKFIYFFFGGRPYITYTLREGGRVAVGCTLIYCGGWVQPWCTYSLVYRQKIKF